ncbi:glycosylphosphatidylinositol anchor attachment 1 protein-like protein, partial [Dinothrombium tinctorium]
ENALLPGLVNRELKVASFTSDLYGALKNESVNYNNKIPYSWITSQFTAQHYPLEAIQSAVNLEIHSDQNPRMELKIEGSNVQLPNLDLFNVAVELATRESITPSFHEQSHPFAADHWEIWKEHVLTIGSMMISQAIGLP